MSTLRPTGRINIISRQQASTFLQSYRRHSRSLAEEGYKSGGEPVKQPYASSRQLAPHNGGARYELPL